MQTRVGSQSPSKGGCFFVITTWLLSLGTWHRSWNFALKYSLLSEEQGQAARVSLKFKFRYCPACYFHKFRWEWSPFCCHSFLPWLSFLSVRERLVIPLASCQWMPVTECGADVPDGAQRELWHIFFFVARKDERHVGEGRVLFSLFLALSQLTSKQKWSFYMVRWFTVQHRRLVWEHFLRACEPSLHPKAAAEEDSEGEPAEMSFSLIRTKPSLDDRLSKSLLRNDGWRGERLEAWEAATNEYNRI